MNDEPIFIDTNILVYAYDEAIDDNKNKKCFNLIQECLLSKKRVVISNQIISEFINVVTKKISNPMSIQRTQKIVKWINAYGGYTKLNYNISTIEKALEFVNVYNAPYWDALIAATMLENGITTIYTENEKDFNRIKEIKVINPLN